MLSVRIPTILSCRQSRPMGKPLLFAIFKQAVIHPGNGIRDAVTRKFKYCMLLLLLRSLEKIKGLRHTLTYSFFSPSSSFFLQPVTHPLMAARIFCFSTLRIKYLPVLSYFSVPFLIAFFKSITFFTAVQFLFLTAS